MHKKTRNAVLVAAAVAVTAAGAGSWYCAASRPVDPMELYETTSPAVEDVRRTITGEAHVRTSGSTALYVETSQTVRAVHVETGDWVEAGQLLVEYDIDPDVAELNRKISEARIYQQNAALNMENIARPAQGNERIQYETALLTAEKSIQDTEAEIESLHNKLRQQELQTDNLRRISSLYHNDYRYGDLEVEDYDIARTNYRVAQTEYEGLVAQLDAKIAALESYEAQWEYARERLDNALDPLGDASTAARYAIQQNLAGVQALTVAQYQDDLTRLREETVSPADGFVTAVNVVEGGAASSGVAVIELASTGESVVRFEASEYDAPQIALGQRVVVTADGLTGREYHGTVTKIHAHALEKEGSDDNEIVVPVEITLTDAGEELKVGYSVDVELIFEEAAQVLSLPLQAVAYEGEEAYVYIVSEGEVWKRTLELGLEGDRTVEVRSGIETGDIVVANPREVS